MKLSFLLGLLFFAQCFSLTASADIRIIVNTSSRIEIFGDELNDKKAAKRIQRKLRGTKIKKLGCLEEGNLEEGLIVVGGTCFMQQGSCGFNAVNELNNYVQSFINTRILYVNCSAKFLKERIPDGLSGYSWNEAIDKVLELQSDKNIENIFLVCIRDSYKSENPELDLQFDDKNIVANCEMCSTEGYYYWMLDGGKPKKQHSEVFSTSKSFSKIECYWQDDLSGCKSNTYSLKGKNKLVRKDCDIKLSNPTFSETVEYKDAKGNRHKLVTMDSEFEDDCYIFHESPHSTYFILLDSICDVLRIQLFIKDVNGNEVSSDLIFESSDLFEVQERRLEKQQLYDNREIKERGDWYSELQVLKYRPKSFLLRFSPNAFSTDDIPRFHEVFYLSAVYYLNSGEKIEVKPMKVLFNPCE
jgi:hypothetical protein